MIQLKEAIQKSHSRNCSCINGKYRDNNYEEVLNEVYSEYKKDLKLLQETHRELMNDKQKEIDSLKNRLLNSCN